MKICGVEEAGRGPVIGPLVMCGLLIDDSKEHELKTIGAKDSKLLTPSQREGLYGKILKLTEKHKIIILQPDTIDDAVQSKTNNLNWLEAETSAEIINELSPDVAYIDCPSPNIPAYTKRLQSMVKGKVKLIAEHKADVNYPIVSAASIIAKVTRDREIEKLKAKVGINFGSGYPADPITKEFLKKYHNKFPGLFRKSWAPFKKALSNKKQSSLEKW
ncbi:MAG: ribonuclease HII [Nanoarchaeota archaeon]